MSRAELEGLARSLRVEALKGIGAQVTEAATHLANGRAGRGKAEATLVYLGAGLVANLEDWAAGHYAAAQDHARAETPIEFLNPQRPDRAGQIPQMVPSPAGTIGTRVANAIAEAVRFFPSDPARVFGWKQKAANGLANAVSAALVDFTTYLDRLALRDAARPEIQIPDPTLP